MQQGLDLIPSTGTRDGKSRKERDLVDVVLFEKVGANDAWHRNSVRYAVYKMGRC